MLKDAVANLLQRATDKCWNPANGKSGWKRTGLAPFDVNRVREKWVSKQKGNKLPNLDYLF